MYTPHHARYAYCKNGDVTKELRELATNPGRIPPGGGLHYVATFLDYVGPNPALLISSQPRPDTHEVRGVSALTLRRSSGPQGLISILQTETSIFLQTLRRLIAFKPTSVLCAASGAMMWASIMAARVTGARLVCTRHESLHPATPNISTKIWRYINEFGLRRATTIMCHGPFLHKELSDLGIPSSRLYEFNLSYRYLLDTPRDRSPLLDRLPPNAKIILYVGRIRTDKGVLQLLEAASTLLSDQPSAALVYAGDGRDFAELEEANLALPRPQRATLLGFVPHDQLHSLIENAFVVVTPTMSTSTESRCKAAIESMVLGTPVVGPDFGPFPYLIRHGQNGLLYTPDSTANLQEKLRSLFEDQALHARLKRGACETGIGLRDSRTTFADALRATLDDPRDNRV